MPDQRDPFEKLTEVFDRVGETQPDGRWRAELKTKMLARGRELAPAPPRPRFYVGRRVAALAAALLFSSSGVVYAASGATPDSPLYPIKKSMEKAALAVTRTFAAKRLSEAPHQMKRRGAVENSRARKLPSPDGRGKVAKPPRTEPKIAPAGKRGPTPHGAPKSNLRQRGKQEGRKPIRPGV